MPEPSSASGGWPAGGGEMPIFGEATVYASTSAPSSLAAITVKKQRFNAPQQAPEPQGEPPTGGSEPGSPSQEKYREFIIQEIDARVGTEIMSKAAFDKTRETCPGYTTCLDFASQVKVGTDKRAGVKPKNFYATAFKEVVASRKESMPPGAWHQFSPGSTKRPRPGDFVITIKIENRNFQHVAVLRAIEPGDKGFEKWTFVDGGGLTAKKPTSFVDPNSGDCKNKNQVKYGWQATTRVNGWVDMTVVHESEKSS